jgi:hypothetical protein
MNKRGYEFGFSWIFAVIVGAFIIFLAVFIAMKFADMERTRIDAERGKEIGVLLTPVETGLEQSALNSIVVPNNQETKLFNGCEAPSTGAPFGTQKISAKVKVGVGQEWQSLDAVRSSFHNKYLFSRNEIQAKKEFMVLSKPFLFPFKIADLIIMWPDNEVYCFVNTNTELKEELADLNPKNILLSSSIADCPSASRKVCFGSSNPDCNILVQSSQKKVTYVDRGNAVVNYVESSDSTNKYPLLLAAIFSDPDLYNCQITRLMGRASNLADLYISKSQYLSAITSCRSAPQLPISLRDYQSSTGDIAQLKNKMEDLKSKNEQLNCKLF